MPYKGLESFNIEEDCIKRWAEDLNPRTAINYVYYLLKYLRWLKDNDYWQSAQAMLYDYARLDQKDQFKHIDVMKDYIKSKTSGSTDRQRNWYAIQSFYEYHRLSLPKLPRNESSRLFQPSESDKRRALELAPLQLEEVRELLLNLSQPYRAIVMVMFQGAIGLSEFTQFNEQAWHHIVDYLDETGPVRVDLYRSKTSRRDVKKYYTFLGEDAKNQIKQWLQIRPKDQSLEELFLTFNKNTGQWVPVRTPLIGSAITKAAKRSGLIHESELQRYHIHAHELRDLFKSLCTLFGVNNVASEYFLGHTVDKFGYDKSPEYDVDWFRNEYSKVEPLLNIISNPKGVKGEEDLKKTFKRELLAVAGYSDEEINEMNIEDASDEDVRALIRNKLVGMMQENVSRQRVIPIGEVERYISQGWEYVNTLPNDTAIIKLPI